MGDSVDLAVAMQDERVAVFLNDGNGVFAHMGKRGTVTGFRGYDRHL